MIEFRILGTLDLRTAAEHPAASVLAQPKRLAVLTYLALARPRGFHRRDTLIALFWPELDQEHARAMLRKTIYHLRQALGSAALVSRGDEELALADDFRCDAVELEQAVAAGDSKRAFELYRGPLLNGFFISDAPEFEDWLERERTRFKDMAFTAACALADEEEQRGDLFAAAHRARQALELLATDETALRKLLGLLERIDDRAAALTAYEQFATRLAAEFDAQPSDTTIALIERIRRRAETSEPAPTPTAEVPLAIAAVAPTATKRGMKQRAILVATALLVLFAGGQAVRRAVSSASATTTSIGVLPFSYQGSTEYAYLAQGLASLLATNLDGADVTEAVGLQRYVRGDIIQVGDVLRVRAIMYDARQSELAQATGEGSVAELFGLVDRLAAQLIAGEAGSRGTNVELAARTTRSLPALKAYLEGEAEFRAGDYTSAVAAYSDAIREDSTFALAYYRLAASYGWTGDSLALPTAQLAVRHADRLAVPDRQLLEALVPFYEGRAGDAERRYRAILNQYPFEREAWFPLGDLLFHFNPIRGASILESRQPFEYALKHGPADGPLTHLVELAAMDGDYAAFDTLFGKLASDGHFAIVGRTVQSFTTGTQTDQRTALAELDTVPVRDLAMVARHVPFLIDDHAAGARVLAHIAESSRPREVRALAHILLAHLAAGSGRFRAAMLELDQAAAFDRTRALEHRAFLLALPFAPVAAHQKQAVRAALAAWDPKEDSQSGVIFPADDGLHPLFRTYLDGLLAAGSASPAAAGRLAQQLDHAARTTGRPVVAQNLATGVRARMHWQQRDARAALAQLEGTTIERGAADLMSVVPFFSLPHERWLRGEVLLAAGRTQEALGWYASFQEHSPFGRAFRAQAELRQAEIYQRMGKRALAIKHYRYFVHAYRDCDPELKPVLERATRALSALQAQI